MRSWTLSAVLLATATAFGQQPLPPKSEATTNTEAFLKAVQVEKPPAPGSVDEAVLNALRQHPDIKMAEAKVRLAEAEAEQAKAQVALRVAAAFAKLEQAKAELVPAQEFVNRIKGPGASVTEVLSAQAQFQRAKSAVVAAEVELNAAKGTAPRLTANSSDPNQAAVEAGIKWLARNYHTDARTDFWTMKAVPAGTAADKLRALVGKTVKLDLKDADIDAGFAAILNAAGEPTLTVKLPTLGKKYLKQPPTATAKGEMSFTAAVQFILDEINGSLGGVPDGLQGRYDVYVREYGLLIARVQDAPKDAPTLTEFARQVRAEKK